MRRSGLVVLALAAMSVLSIAPAHALDRLASPASNRASIVTRIADLDRPMHARRYRGGSDWRYRAAYTRWLHNEYVVAGYPVHQYRTPTYYWIEPCCYRHRHW